MAEVVGLVIGGVALVGLFDSCMNLLDTIDAGRNFEDDYQQAALKVVLLRCRLDRWERTYRNAEGKAAEWALNEIHRCLQAARETGEPYLPRNSKSSGSMAVARVTDGMEALVTRNKPAKATVTQQASWALRGKGKMDGIISNLDFFIRNLESLSGDVTAPGRRQAADKEALGLVQPSAIEEPETSIPILQQAAAAVDPELGAAVKWRGHTFKNYTISDSATSIKGDYVAPGMTATLPPSSYENITVRGNAVSMSGNSYGGGNPLVAAIRMHQERRQ